MSESLGKGIQNNATKTGRGGSRLGAGRPKGIPNKFNAQLKDMILTALENAGGIGYLTAQAHENPKTFLLLLGRVLPLQVTGEGDKPLELVMRWAVSDAEGTSDPSAEIEDMTAPKQIEPPRVRFDA